MLITKLVENLIEWSKSQKVPKLYSDGNTIHYDIAEHYRDTVIDYENLWYYNERFSNTFTRFGLGDPNILNILKQVILEYHYDINAIWKSSKVCKRYRSTH